MAIEQRQVQVAKELDDCMVLVVNLVKDIKAGKNAGDIVSGSIPELMAALSGVDQVGAEVEANRAVALSTVGLRLGDLIDAIIGKPAA